MNNKKINIIIYIGIFIYVGIGTFSVCALYPKDILWCGDWIVFSLLFTFPVSIISFIYRFVEANTLYPVFIIQLITLFIWLGIAFFALKKNKQTT